MLFEVSSQFIARFNHRGLNFVSEEFVKATDSTAQPAVAIWACCSRLALSSLPALIIVASILSPKS